MRPIRVSGLLAETTNMTQYPPEVVSSVIEHAFSFIKEYIAYPTHAGLRIPYWGVIRPNPKSIPKYLQFLISKLREDPTNEDLKERFRYY